MRTRTVSTALAVLFSSTALAVGTTGSAMADSSKALPISSYGDIAVDGVHKRVYISDPSGNKVVVTDYAGKVVTTVPNLPGVQDLAIAPDSRSVYAAVPGSDAVVAIETATSTAAAQYGTGENTRPQTLAVAGGRVWFMYGKQPSHHLGSFDPAQSSPEVALDQLPGIGWYDAPELESAGNTLVLGVHGTWSGLAVYDVSTSTPVLRKQGMPSEAANYMDDFALSADGKKIVAASGESPYAATAINTDDLTRTGGYPTKADHPNSAAIAPDGTVALSTYSWYDTDIYIYKPGATTPYRTYTYGQGTPGGDTITSRGLAWAPRRDQAVRPRQQLRRAVPAGPRRRHPLPGQGHRLRARQGDPRQEARRHRQTDLRQVLPLGLQGHRHPDRYRLPQGQVARHEDGRFVRCVLLQRHPARRRQRHLHGDVRGRRHARARIGQGHGRRLAHRQRPHAQPQRRHLLLRRQGLVHRPPRQDVQEPHRRDLGRSLRRRQAQEAAEEGPGQLQGQPVGHREHDP
ncbi:hypothetical protein [Streptomyces atratus]|uniref:hypothetical protein n=1 Tax=Streptomyces atratus TaxID=1893 RepID=UPI002AC36DAA|nr:hypothetical protein [Streptomyces atratus]